MGPEVEFRAISTFQWSYSPRGPNTKEVQKKNGSASAIYMCRQKAKRKRGQKGYEVGEGE